MNIFLLLHICEDITNVHMNYEFDKIFLGFQPCQVVAWRVTEHFEDHLCPCHQRTDLLSMMSK